MLRVIRELKPTWVVGENVPGIVSLALDTVLSDLEAEGYEVQTFVIPACGVDAPHRRDRVAILAHALNWGGTLRGDRELQNTASDAGQRSDHRRGTPAAQPRERRQDKSRLTGVADGIRTAVHKTHSDPDADRLQGRHIDKVVDDASFTDCSSREREREIESRGYDGLLRSFLEVTPLGIIGRMNPEWVEWLMGYPIGWTELNALETR
jgi:site-specific DNA-cytosine methylase